MRHDRHETDQFSRELVDLLPRLRRFARSLCRSTDVAEDLLQTTCIKAIRSKANYQPGTRMDAWLFRIMRNNWIDDHRQAKSHGVHVEIDDAFGIMGQDGETIAQSKLMLGSAAKAIDQLPSDQREVLLLVCVEDFTYREAAELLDLPIGTVMSRLARARLRISESLGINEGEDRSVKGEGRRHD